jgi:hypothetical protein
MGTGCDACGANSMMRCVAEVVGACMWQDIAVQGELPHYSGDTTLGDDAGWVCDVPAVAVWSGSTSRSRRLLFRELNTASGPCRDQHSLCTVMHKTCWPAGPDSSTKTQDKR